MKINIITLDNKQGEPVTLNQDIFGLEPRKDILHRVVEWQRAKRRAGTHKTKQRGEVRGTTKKPFKQKGTGHARQGSLKGPHQIGGGIAHGPQVRSHAYSLPKNIRNLGLKCALSLKAKEGKLRVFDTLVVQDAKTGEMAKKLEALGISSALFVRGDNPKDAFYNSIQNIPYMDQIPVIGLNVYDILKHDEIALTTHALKALEERLK